MFRNKTKVPLVTNDIGYGFFKDLQGTSGVSVPLSNVLSLMIRRRNTERIDINFVKHPILGHVMYIPTLEFTCAEVKMQNRVMAAVAKSEIYGATEDIVISSWTGRGTVQTEHPGQGILAPDNFNVENWIYEYWRFLSTMGISEEAICGAMGGNFIINSSDRAKFRRVIKL